MDVTSPTAATALVVLVPQVEEVVGRWRADLDPSATQGMPAHVTILMPWLPPDRLHDGELGALHEIAARVPAFDVDFHEFGRFERTLWLAPRPGDAFVRLTLEVERRWPETPAYSGRFPSVVPHLSIGDAVDPDKLGHVVADVAPRLPVSARVDEMVLMVRDEAGRWDTHSRYPLG
jgi:2'-5' RNA ligase superfamily protein